MHFVRHAVVFISLVTFLCGVVCGQMFPMLDHSRKQQQYDFSNGAFKAQFPGQKYEDYISINNPNGIRSQGSAENTINYKPNENYPQNFQSDIQSQSENNPSIGSQYQMLHFNNQGGTMPYPNRDLSQSSQPLGMNKYPGSLPSQGYYNAGIQMDNDNYNNAYSGHKDAIAQMYQPKYVIDEEQSNKNKNQTAEDNTNIPLFHFQYDEKESDKNPESAEMITPHYLVYPTPAYISGLAFQANHSPTSKTNATNLKTNDESSQEKYRKYIEGETLDDIINGPKDNESNSDTSLSVGQQKLQAAYNYLYKLPKEQQPFYLLNKKAIEQNRDNPQIYDNPPKGVSLPW